MPQSTPASTGHGRFIFFKANLLFQRIDDLKQEWKGSRDREVERKMRRLAHDRRRKEKENTHDGTLWP